MTTASFEEIKEMAREAIGGGKRGAKVGGKKHTIGERVEVCQYAAKFGNENAITRFKVSESNLYNWMAQFRKGLYNGVPPDRTMIYRTNSYKKPDTQEVEKLRAENTRLTVENNYLRELIPQLIGRK